MERTVIVLVLGDVGRSPRMQYHALSLAASCPRTRVVLVGYRGERCVPEIVRQPDRIEQLRMAPEVLPGLRRYLPYAVYAIVKAALGLLQLLWVLLVRAPRADVLLVQTPPAIPTLAAVWLVRALRCTRVIVDWHNLAFTVMAQGGLGASHPLVRLSRGYERQFSVALDDHLCVTDAMARWLRAQWGVAARVLHDRPPAFFRPLPVDEQHELLLRLRPQLEASLHGAPRPLPSRPRFQLTPSARTGAPLGVDDADDAEISQATRRVIAPRRTEGAGRGAWGEQRTPWTQLDEGGAVVRRADAPAILISSTSWTADEDFGVLLQALRSLDASLVDAEAAPADGPRPARVVALVTGKGPLKAAYEAEVRTLKLRRVAIGTLWLEPLDYPRLLGCADLGVSLHSSTSGLDLPMKARSEREGALVGAATATLCPHPRSCLPLLRCSTCSAAGCPSARAASTASASWWRTASTGWSSAPPPSSPSSCASCSRPRQTPRASWRACARAWPRPRRSGPGGTRTGRRCAPAGWGRSAPAARMPAARSPNVPRAGGRASFRVASSSSSAAREGSLD
jgi:beta-1,4-mannosyltransferase